MAFRKQGKDQFLAVPEETVRTNFEMYQALDSNVFFHKGQGLFQFHAAAVFIPALPGSLACGW